MGAERDEETAVQHSLNHHHGWKRRVRHFTWYVLTQFHIRFEFTVDIMQVFLTLYVGTGLLAQCRQVQLP